MDFVTHACVGAVAGRLGSSEAGRPARAAMALGALAALLPDADHVLELVSAEAYFVHHRGLTHGLAFAALAAALAGFLPGGPFRALSGARRALVVAGALATHLALDVCTPFGTMLLAPFDDRLFALDALPIVAPWAAGIAILGCVATILAEKGWGRRRPAMPRAISVAAIAALASFAGFEGNRAHTIGAVALDIAFLEWPPAEPGRERLPPPRLLLAVPAVNDPFDVTEIFLHAAPVLVHTREHDWCFTDTEYRPIVSIAPTGSPAPADLAAQVASIEGRPEVRRLLRRFRVPIASVSLASRGPDPHIGVIVWRDAQFGAIVPEDRWPLTITGRLRGLVSGPIDLEVEQRPRGPQVVLYLVVLLATAAIARRAGAFEGSRST